MSLSGADLASPLWYPSHQELIKRPFYHDGIAVDDRPLFEVDDQIAAHDLGDGEFLARVHLANVGLLRGTIYVDPAIEKVRSEYSTQGKRRVCNPLFPDQATEMLSLDRFTPIGIAAMTLTFGINANGIGAISYEPSRVQAHGITYKKFNDRLADSDSNLVDMYSVATLLRHHLLGEEVPRVKCAEDVIEAYMLAANVLIRRTINTDERPLLKRNYVGESYELASGKIETSKASYGAVALGHARFHGRKISKFSAGLRRAADFVNHMQATGEPPYDEADIIDLAEYFTAKEREFSPRARRPKNRPMKLVIIKQSA